MANENQCSHKPCNCSATGDNDYCSDHCRDASDSDLVEIKCDCGHPACG